MMNYKEIIVNIDKNICLIKLNRPEVRNALSIELMEELVDVFQKIEHDDQIKAVILTGEGSVFCAGGNIKNKNTKRNLNDTRKIVKNSQKLLRTMLNLEKPIIAAVNGAAVGAGFSLALACDLILATSSTFFAQSFALRGAIPDLGSIHFLSQLLGKYRTKELMFLGERITAEKACQFGIVSEVVDDDSLLDSAFELAKKLAKGSSISIGLIKQLVNQNVNHNFEESLELEAFGQAVAFQTEDFKEGVTAFFEKRTPQFKGR
ncbi:enoyl-CoA hydratase/isomerase family protein [Neobacillus sp. NRS-1170]|uniref:enoyl-CoA hydratase/isomerase family protein n=1 Tax=Neobacillus sp. NRS-1170 TaxID=3233898 RepID=UPI003D298DC4